MSRESIYKLMDQVDDDSYILDGLIRFLPEYKVDEFVAYFRRTNNVLEKLEDEELEGEELEVEEFEDEDGNTIFVIPGVQFTGDEETDLDQLKDPMIYNWIFPNLGNDALTDAKMLVIYEADDVRDYLD